MIGMNLETIKSIILTVLVGISLVLTYIQWTFQPGYEAYSEENDLIQPVTISEERTIGEVVLPTKLLIHRNTGTFGTGNVNTINEVMDLIKKWEFSQLNDITLTVHESDFFSFVHGEGKVELVFEDYVPLQLYNQVMKFQEEHSRSWKFDRIIIDMKEYDGYQVPVYFVSYLNNGKDDRKIYQSSATGAEIESLQTKYYQLPSRLNVYDFYEVADVRRIYYPRNQNNEVSVDAYKFMSLPSLDKEAFKDALFSNPSIVKSRWLTGGEEYSDSYNLLRFNNNRNSLSFINPVGGTESLTPDIDILGNSIDFINGHAGWTDLFIYDNWDKYKSIVTFNLYYQGLPVFSEELQIPIDLQWGSQYIVNYTRPNFQLKDTFYYLAETDVFLPTGGYVIQQLEKQIELNNLQDLKIGYKMEKDKQTNQIYLEPRWYYLLAGKWLSIKFKDGGGDQRGLE